MDASEAAWMTDAAIPLVLRAPDDVLFRLPDQTVDAATFVAGARRLADSLPDRPYVLNLCQDRLRFSLSFAAAVLRGQVSLLTSDRSPGRLAGLAATYGDLYALTDAADVPEIGLPQCAVGRLTDAAPTEGVVPAIPADRLAALVFTSGSTGQPVGHRKLWGALATRSIDGGGAIGVQAKAPAAIVALTPPQHSRPRCCCRCMRRPRSGAVPAFIQGTCRRRWRRSRRPACW
jgi:acyl-CoA synthetase (AMP-forming)/AMP-acid ligase II